MIEHPPVRSCPIAERHEQRSCGYFRDADDLQEKKSIRLHSILANVGTRDRQVLRAKLLAKKGYTVAMIALKLDLPEAEVRTIAPAALADVE